MLLRFAILRIRCRGQVSLLLRSQWLHRSCATITARLSLQVTAEGPLPGSGLVVANHLSYLDILFFSSRMPCIFISKSEVLSWPIFGILARCGGTIFVQRGRGSALDDVSRQLSAALRAGVAVVLFPEGTSTDGSTVLRFYPGLFQTAVDIQAPVTASAITYEADDGKEADLCYYGDITFAPHLFTVLSRKRVKATILFEDSPATYPDRKKAATTAHEHVTALRRAFETKMKLDRVNTSVRRRP